MRIDSLLVLLYVTCMAMLSIPLAEKVSEVLGIELGKAAAIVDGLADNEHGGEGEMVVVDNLGEVFEDSAIDLLVRPREMIAGGNGCILGIFLKEFALDIIDDGGAEEDAHRALATSQQMQLFFLRHGCAALATGENNRLATLRNRELALQLGSSCKE